MCNGRSSKVVPSPTCLKTIEIKNNVFGTNTEETIPEGIYLRLCEG